MTSLLRPSRFSLSHEHDSNRTAANRAGALLMNGRLSSAALVIVVASIVLVAPLSHAQPCDPVWGEAIGVIGTNAPVHSLVVFDDGTGPALYAGGEFTEAGGTSAYYIAKWTGNTWLPVGGGMDGAVYALTVFDDGTGPALYAGGAFVTAGGVTVNGVARWDGGSWSALGSGVSGCAFADPPGSPCWTVVEALAVYDDGVGNALYVGGSFELAGGQTTNGVARWDGSVWSALGSGVAGCWPSGWCYASVKSLAVWNDGAGDALYAGGVFEQADGLIVNSVARWDGVSWSPLNGGVSGGLSTVDALTVFDDGSGPSLYVGGFYIAAGGLTTNNIAKWDGVAWAALNAGMNSRVNALAVFDDESGAALYAGGGFTTAGGAGASYIARWDGGAWSALSSGTDDTVRALTVFDDTTGDALYAGGDFTDAGGSSASYIARWGCVTLLNVTGHSPQHPDGPVSHVDVTFSQPVDPNTFDITDISIEGPGGPIAADPNSPQYQGANTWRIEFPEQSADGEYHVHVGSHIANVAGNEMDQDGDGVAGEDLDDVYDAMFVLGVTVFTEDTLVNDGDAPLRAEPVIVEPGWALTRTVDFANGTGAHYNPVDGRLYVGRRVTAIGLYRIEADGTATALWTGDECLSVLIDPDDGDVFCAEHISGRILRTAFGSTGHLSWVTGFHNDDDDPRGMAIAPVGYALNGVSAGDALVVDPGYNGLDEIWHWSPDVRKVSKSSTPTTARSSPPQMSHSTM